jgi:hypothetical protein
MGRGISWRSSFRSAGVSPRVLAVHPAWSRLLSGRFNRFTMFRFTFDRRALQYVCVTVIKLCQRVDPAWRLTSRDVSVLPGEGRARYAASHLPAGHLRVTQAVESCNLVFFAPGRIRAEGQHLKRMPPKGIQAISAQPPGTIPGVTASVLRAIWAVMEQVSQVRAHSRRSDDTLIITCRSCNRQGGSAFCRVFSRQPATLCSLRHHRDFRRHAFPA